ncbi:hypothetical protein [Corynebacterium urinipleomorphum]|uniref:hypothetical protein n=1 Tax=Corynebacterium urinipleomorphum TaxID=1852380 RepID=UPI000B35D20D|nr:hypothetical protein [Corynebacterium urinipleomorphum]
MTTPNNPNDFPSYGDYPSYGDGQNPGQDSLNEYSQDPTQGFGQGQYPATSGYVNPETQSESGRPLHIPAQPLPVAEPIPFGFKRLFTSQWHVYIGLMFLPMLIGMIGGAIFILPQIINDANRGVEELSTSTSATMTIWQVLVSILSLVFSLVVYKVALKDTRGVKPTWNNAFKDVPWGQGILAYILTALAFGVAFVALMFVSGLIGSQVPALGVVLIVLTIIGFIFLYPFMVMIPLYAVDGKTTAAGAFAAGWNDVKANYWRVFGALLLVGLVTAGITIFTLGLGALIAAPAQVLASVFVYRWISDHGETAEAALQSQPYQHPEQPGGYMSMY